MNMTEEILFTHVGQIGLITLNRPSALNALSLPMILQLQKQLHLWKDDDSVKAVVLRAVPGSAFCAGGDVRWLYEAGRGGDHSEQMSFFWHEYRLNHFIHHFGKPYISLMDGVTMGGGVGISLHGSHPVASEHFVFAMPETGIGFFPDIGASYLLTRCPGALGIYLGLTGNRLGPHHAMYARLVKQVVASEHMPGLLQELMDSDLSVDANQRVDECLEKYAMTTSLDKENPFNPLINHCFSKPSVEAILDSLQAAEGAWAMGVDNALALKSPLSLKITYAQLQKSKGLSLADCLRMDYDLVTHFMCNGDFYEGVRALLIDKDKNPQWYPTCLDLVSEGMVAGYFERSEAELEQILS